MQFNPNIRDIKWHVPTCLSIWSKPVAKVTELPLCAWWNQ